MIVVLARTKSSVPVLEDATSSAPILRALLATGHLTPSVTEEDGAGQRWTLSEAAAAEGYIRLDGKRFYVRVLNGMWPFYQELYAKIFAERLGAWGLEGADVGVLRADGLVIFWGPDDLMASRQPAAVAAKSIVDGDELWLDGLEQWWREAARALEEQLDAFWSELCAGRTTPGTLRTVIQHKVRLAATGVDALMPPVKQTELWFTGYLPEPLRTDAAWGCYLPASGYVAYDVFELECWRLADVLESSGDVSDEACARFVRRGLFLNYAALDTASKEYWFARYPRQIALQYSRAASDSGPARSRIVEVQERQWHRRYHRQWARQQIESARADRKWHRSMLLLYRLLGTARDFDEEKRRLNEKLWRSVFALADGLSLSLSDPSISLSQMCDSIDRSEGLVSLDPVFTRSQ